MKWFSALFDVRTYILTTLAVVSFSQLVFQIFSQTIPNVVVSFFKELGAVVILAGVFVFALTWLLKARPHNRPKNYSVVIFDVYGQEAKIDGLRIEFKTHDVAWSFMKQYKKEYPLHNFAMVSKLPKSEKRTIFKYI